MGARWVPGGCQVGARWVPGGCKVGARWVEERFKRGSREVQERFRHVQSHVQQIAVPRIGTGGPNRVNRNVTCPTELRRDTRLGDTHADRSDHLEHLIPTRVAGPHLHSGTGGFAATQQIKAQIGIRGAVRQVDSVHFGVEAEGLLIL